MWVIRDKDGRVERSVASAPLLQSIARPGIDRIDLWPAGRHSQVGISWADGASVIGDVPWRSEALWAWFDQRGLGGKIRHHVAPKKEANS